jgi:hypothetical protein
MNHQLCRVSIEEAAHDRPAGRYQRALANKTDELLAGMFDPLSDDNFASFFSADLNEQDIQMLLYMRDALRVGHFDQAANIFKTALVSFYTRLAQIEAQDQIDNADCRQCYDSGCASCFEPEVE